MAVSRHLALFSAIEEWTWGKGGYGRAVRGDGSTVVTMTTLRCLLDIPVKRTD